MQERETSLDLYHVTRNSDASLHPFERAREYTRALNSVKLERLFAKPFIAALAGHRDGIYSLCKHPKNLVSIASGSADGEIRLWDLNTRTSTSLKQQEAVKGICFIPSLASNQLLSIGGSCVRMYSGDLLSTYTSRNTLNSIDHHQSDNVFATGSTCIELWDHERFDPVNTLKWGDETVLDVKFNKTERNLVASCSTDRSIVLYDIRTTSPISKSVMAMHSNAICWNPMEAFNFTVANEDHNSYTFDMRNLKYALHVAMGHVSAVMDIDYSPTGQEFVTASYDKTIRIFNARTGKYREIYHTARMQRGFCVKYAMDSKFIFSGSDDGNVRIWKAQASEKLETLTRREESAFEYQEALKNRYKHMPEIKKIANHRRIPKAIWKASDKKKVMTQSIKRKEANRRKHSKPGSVPFVAERTKHILKTEE